MTISIKYPNEGFLNIPVATDPTINKGPDVEQNETNRWPSNLDIWLLFLSSDASFAPTG